MKKLSRATKHLRVPKASRGILLIFFGVKRSAAV